MNHFSTLEHNTYRRGGGILGGETVRGILVAPLRPTVVDARR